MKIIFLDIDGVLSTPEYIMYLCHHHEKGRLYAWEAQFQFKPCIMRHLVDIVNRTDAYIVISSMWRLFGDRRQVEFDLWKKGEHIIEDEHWNQMMDKLNEYGIGNRVIGITPYFCGVNDKRGDEIRDWLSWHPDVEKFVIIDDDSDMKEFTKTKLAKCHRWFGLTKKIKEKAIKILNRG